MWQFDGNIHSLFMKLLRSAIVVAVSSFKHECAAFIGKMAPNIIKYRIAPSMLVFWQNYCHFDANAPMQDWVFKNLQVVFSGMKRTTYCLQFIWSALFLLHVVSSSSSLWFLFALNVSPDVTDRLVSWCCIKSWTNFSQHIDFCTGWEES